MADMILLGGHDEDVRCRLVERFVADGRDAVQARTRNDVVCGLAEHPVAMLVLGRLARPADVFAVMRALRAAELDPRIDPQLPAITIGGEKELDALSAYEAGSDHHLPVGASYLLVRAVVEAVERRVRPGRRPSRRYEIGALRIDTAARIARVKEEPVQLTAIEFALLTALATDPARVFTRDELLREVWGFQTFGRTRTLDAHAARLRAKLSARGERYVINVWGIGYRLIDP